MIKYEVTEIGNQACENIQKIFELKAIFLPHAKGDKLQKLCHK